MANQEHLDILKQGVDVWNQWQKEHPLIDPDFKQAQLTGIQLTSANLRYANLREANLRRTDLHGANLEGASLSAAHLSRANLSRANLSRANLMKTDLHGANLTGVDLSEANLRSTDLNNVILQEANLMKTDLRGADLTGANLSRANLKRAKLRGAKLIGADLTGADLTGANLHGAKLHDAKLNSAVLIKANLKEAILHRAILHTAKLQRAHLTEAQFKGADLEEANLNYADLRRADLQEVNLRSANLSNAILSRATLVNTNLEAAILTDCQIHGISAWNVQMQGATQINLVITSDDEPTITVDNLEVAQFIYLLLNNYKIREVIDTIARKAVLILGRFTPERKAILEAIREMLRQRGYLPILFDFEKPVSRDITETVSTLAHMARFVIADITDAKSIPQELMLIVPNLPSVPVQPLILEKQHEYGMFEHFIRYPWVLPVYRYSDVVSLLHSLQEKVIAPAEEMAQEVAKR